MSLNYPVVRIRKEPENKQVRLGDRGQSIAREVKAITEKTVSFVRARR